MIKAEMTEGKITYFDSQHSDFQAIVQQECGGWYVAIECPTIAPPEIVEFSYIPVLRAATRTATAMNA